MFDLLILGVAFVCSGLALAWGGELPVDFRAKITAQAEDIIGIEYLYTAPNQGPLYSRWGHSGFRLINPKIKPRDNLTISFVADVNLRELNLLKGVTGGYRIIEKVTTTEDYWIEARKQNRRIERYILSLTDVARKRALEQLLLWFENPKLMGDYTFFSNNCAGVLSRFFRAAGIMQEVTLFPDGIASELFREGVSPFPPLVVPDSSEAWKTTQRLLNVSRRKWPTLTSFSEEELKLVLREQGPLTLARLLYGEQFLDDETRSTLYELLDPYFNALREDEIFYMVSPPVDLYRASSSTQDFARINQIRRDFFGRLALDQDLVFLAGLRDRDQCSIAMIHEKERIQADPAFRKYRIKNVDCHLGNQVNGVRLRTRGSRLYAQCTTGERNQRNSGELIPLKGSIRTYDEWIQVGEISCKVDPTTSTGLSKECMLIAERTPSGVEVWIAGYLTPDSRTSTTVESSQAERAP